MRKLFSLLLCLTLFLPVMAIAEAEATLETYKIDFGDFTMTLCEGDYHRVTPEKTNNVVYATIYPAYDESATSHNNICVSWCKDDVSASFARPDGPEAYANTHLSDLHRLLIDTGIRITDEQVLDAKYEDGIGSYIIFFNLVGANVDPDLIIPVYERRTYFFKGEAGTYIFDISTSSYEDLEALSSYLDSVEFK